MRRICGEREKQIIIENKAQLCNNPQVPSLGKMRDIFIALGIWLLLLVPSVLILVFLTEVSALAEKCLSDDGMVKIVIIAELCLISYITNRILAKRRLKKEKKRFIKPSLTYMVNGATVTDIICEEKEWIIRFIEDDEKNNKGEIYQVEQSAIYEAVRELDRGDRLLLVHGMQGEHNGAMYVLKINSALENIIADSKPVDLSRIQLKEIETVPHPTCAVMDREPLVLDEAAKAVYKKRELEKRKKQTKSLYKGLAVVEFIAVNMLATVIGLTMFWEKGIIWILMMYVVVNILVVLFFAVLWKIFLKNVEKQTDYKTKQEVMYLTTGISNNISFVLVLEWCDGVLTTKQYTLVDKLKCCYGTKLVKYTGSTIDRITKEPAAFITMSEL